ncbi:MAG: sensor histidine kinase [Gemmatimonadaceae bacterium]
MSPAARPPRRGATRGRTTVATPEGEGDDATASAAAPDAGAPNGGEKRGGDIAPAIDGAIADVVANWSYGEHSRLTPEDVETTARRLAALLRDAEPGSEPASLEGLLPFVPSRRVLEALRAAVLERAAPSVEAKTVVQVARAFERVQRVLDEHAAQRFASRLTGVEAQQLIVEMAHDMRSPLNSILILAERLRSGAGGDLTPVQERQLGLIYSAGFGLSALASDVIELARGGTTLVELQPLPFSVADVLQSVLDILRPMAEEKRLTMTASGPRADFRMGHASALNRVLLNLTTNAIKFTSTGSVAVTCRELDRTRIEFSVQDTGRGIPQHVLDNLFEAFRQRAAPGDYAFSSAGLGLSICQLLVRAMGGELAVETEIERGTRFYFTLDLPQSGRM